MTLIVEKPPPKGRVSKCDGLEQHLYEPAVMLAMASWLFCYGAKNVCLHPDGMHAKQFGICNWLTKGGFKKVAAKGQTTDAGTYIRECRTYQQTLVVEFTPGRGDVVADVQGSRIVVEAKGGIINSRCPGQKSKLRKRLYEAVGMLLDGPSGADRLIAAVPLHRETEKIANRIQTRCRHVGVEVALVSGEGDVQLYAGRLSE